jgi:hypothetical protein
MLKIIVIFGQMHLGPREGTMGLMEGIGDINTYCLCFLRALAYVSGF